MCGEHRHHAGTLYIKNDIVSGVQTLDDITPVRQLMMLIYHGISEHWLMSIFWSPLGPAQAVTHVHFILFLSQREILDIEDIETRLDRCRGHLAQVARRPKQ